jgi:hypothetical protein
METNCFNNIGEHTNFKAGMHEEKVFLGGGVMIICYKQDLKHMS